MMRKKGRGTRIDKREDKKDSKLQNNKLKGSNNGSSNLKDSNSGKQIVNLKGSKFKDNSNVKQIGRYKDNRVSKDGGIYKKVSIERLLLTGPKETTSQDLLIDSAGIDLKDRKILKTLLKDGIAIAIPQKTSPVVSDIAAPKAETGFAMTFIADIAGMAFIVPGLTGGANLIGIT